MASLEGFADAKRSTPVAAAQKTATTTPSPQRSSAPLAGFAPAAKPLSGFAPAKPVATGFAAPKSIRARTGAAAIPPGRDGGVVPRGPRLSDKWVSGGSARKVVAKPHTPASRDVCDDCGWRDCQCAHRKVVRVVRAPLPAGAACRVCFCGEEEGRLFAPCRCKGTMRWVHPHCLNEWRAASVNARSFYTCEQCGYRYRTERTWLADVLQSERTVWLLSFAMLALVALAGRLVPGRPERLLFALLEWEPSAASAASWWGWWAGASERAMVALMWPGALGFGFSVADAYRLHRGIPLGQQGWLSALVLSIAANGRRISRVLVACGLLYFLGRLASRLRQRARRLLTRWGEVVLEAGA